MTNSVIGLAKSVVENARSDSDLANPTSNLAKSVFDLAKKISEFTKSVIEITKSITDLTRSELGLCLPGQKVSDFWSFNYERHESGEISQPRKSNMPRQPEPADAHADTGSTQAVSHGGQI